MTGGDIMLQGHSRWVTRGTPGSRLPGPVTMQYVYTYLYRKKTAYSLFNIV